MVQPIKRKPAQIHERMTEIAERDFTGRERSALLESLDWREAQRYLRDDAPHTEQSWAATQKITVQDLTNEAEGILDQSWTSANARRSTMVKKAVAFLRGTLWLIDSAKARECLEKIEDDEVFEYFGKPFLVEISEALGISWRNLDDNKWLNEVGDEPMDADTALDQARL